jgi:uncharacterized membrane protein
MRDFIAYLEEKNPALAEGARHTLGAVGISAAGMLGGGALGALTGGVPGAILGGLAGKKAGEYMVPDDWKLKAMKKKMKKK